ncbi:MAG: glycosyltransferase family 39 protein [Planctomycetota bacterium]|jgi:glycerol uptake facilitator-like aquaporin|nr:glycosyltransferase family 39 protein [Planctomycetota bacterium]
MLVRRLFPLVLLAIFIAHSFLGAFVAKNHAEFFLHNDGWEYEELAVSLAQTGTLAIKESRYYEAPRDKVIPDGYRAPLLPALGAIAVTICGGGGSNYLAFAILQTALFTGAAALIFLITRRLARADFAAYLAMGLFIANPLCEQYSLQFCSETLFTLCLLLFIYLALRAGEWRRLPQRKRDWLIIGLAVAAALAFYARQTGFVLFPVFGAVMIYGAVRAWRRGRRVAKMKLRGALIFAAVGILLIAPWGARNYVHFGEFNPAGFQGGFVFFVGNNRDNLAAYRAAPNGVDGKNFKENQERGWNRAIALVKALPLEYHAQPAAQSRYMTEQARREISAMGAGNYLYLLAARAWMFVRPWSVKGLNPDYQFWLLTIYNLALYAAASWGIFICRGRGAAVIGLVILGGVAAHTFVHVYMRHRVPFLEPALIIYAAAAISVILQKVWRRLRARPV